MSRGVDKVKVVNLPIIGFIVERYALRFDGNTTLTFQIHRIQHLCGHFTFGQAAADLDNTVRQRRLTVVNMGNDRKISYVFHLISFSALVFLNYSPMEPAWT
ncbi:hypothetical protein D3C79_479870 [compost metagenome]